MTQNGTVMKSMDALQRQVPSMTDHYSAGASSPSAGTRTSGGSLRVSFPYAQESEDDVESIPGSSGRRKHRRSGRSDARNRVPDLLNSSSTNERQSSAHARIPVSSLLNSSSTNEPPSSPQTQGSETLTLEEGTRSYNERPHRSYHENARAGRDVTLDPLPAPSPYASNPRDTRTQGHSSSFGSPNTPAKASGAPKSKTKGSRTAAPGSSGDPKIRRTRGHDSPSGPLNTLGRTKGASSKVPRPKSPELTQDPLMRGTRGHDLGSGPTQSYDEGQSYDKAVEREGVSARESQSEGYPPYRPYTTKPPTHDVPTEVPRDMGQPHHSALQPQQRGHIALLGIVVPPRSEWKDQRPPELTKQQKSQLPKRGEWTELEIWITVWGWADCLPWKDINALLPNRSSRAAETLMQNLKGNPDFKWAVEFREENKKDIEAANAADPRKVYDKKYYQKKREEIKEKGY